MRLTVRRDRIQIRAENDMEQGWLDKIITDQCEVKMERDSFGHAMGVLVERSIPAPTSASEGRTTP